MKLKKIKTRRKITSIAAAMMTAGLVVTATPAQSLDWGGYFRAGPGSSDNDSSRACYGLNGPGLQYRLGNECDIYAELQLSEKFVSGDVEYKTVVMNDLFNPQTDTGDAQIGLAQLYVEGKGYDVAPSATFWVGKRFYGRKEVHIVDTKFTRLDGVGAGVEIPIGDSNLGLAYFKRDESDTDYGDRFNIDYSGISTNPNGTLRILGTFTDAGFDGGESGLGLTLQHTQDGLLGGANTFLVQYAQGSAGLDGNFGNTTVDSDVKSIRLVENFNWQVGDVGGEAILMWQNDDSNSVETDSISVGGRISYAFTNNFKLVTELGYSEKSPDNEETQELTKFTIAPTLSVGRGFWSRPELRFYVTIAKWNNAANAASVGGLTGAGDGRTSGTSYGLQIETWF